MKAVFSAMLILFCAFHSTADVPLTILHTADLHSHFTNRESRLRLGGFARLKTKINDLRAANQNSLLLDAGDWSEGNIFFTLDSGVATQELLKSFNYDALVLGNHDWLVGPQELYTSFKKAEMGVPVLMANVKFDDLPVQMDLSQYVKPWVIKEVAGKKIGILGLSTFEIVFDHFFRPADVVNPILAARRAVKELREVQKVDYVIVLSHMGFPMDKTVAKWVKGIDAIIGGHSHILLKKPVYVKGTPIFHIGEWGMYMGEYAFNLKEGGGVELKGFKLHQIDRTVSEDPGTATMVDGYKAGLDRLFGHKVFEDVKFHTDVDLPSRKDLSNDFLGNVIVDSYREATDADVALDLPNYHAQDLSRGDAMTADLFGVVPHIFSSVTKKAWTIYTYTLRGYEITLLMKAISRTGISVKISNGSYDINLSTNRIFQRAKNIKIGGKDIKFFKKYTVASTHGVLDAFTELSRKGLPLKAHDIKDTGMEAWRLMTAKLQSLAPVRAESLPWDPRIRVVQGDLHVPGELVSFVRNETGILVRYKVLNAGKKAMPVTPPSVLVDSTPWDTLDDVWTRLPTRYVVPPTSQELEMDESLEMLADWAPTGWEDYPHEVVLGVETGEGEKLTSNNYFRTVVVPSEIH